MRADGILDGALRALDRDLAAASGRARRRGPTSSGAKCKVCGEGVRARDGRAPPYCLEHVTESPTGQRISREWSERLSESERLAAGGRVDLAHPLAAEVLNVASASDSARVSAGRLARRIDLPVCVCVAVLRAFGVALSGRSGTAFSPHELARRRSA